MKCYDCPRACGADRDRGNIGFCGGGSNARIAKIIDDFTYEEPCLGSTVTAVFFGGCALRCSYCQNYEISRVGAGREYNDAELAELFDKASGTIDLVTPSHYLHAIERALPLCKARHGFIYNTSGYETVSAVERARAFTDVFLTDFKYADGEIAARLSSARDYCNVALSAIAAMKKTADVWSNDNGQKALKRGVVVRHLVLPGHVQNSLKALDLIASNFGTDTVISLMSQFTPNGVGEPAARLKQLEYKLVAEHAIKLGFKTGYMQEFSSADRAFIPDFGGGQ